MMLCFNIFSGDGKAEFSAAISQGFRVTRSIRNNPYMLIWCPRIFIVIINVENSCSAFQDSSMNRTF